MFSNINWLSLQGPLLMVVSMVTGKDVNTLLALEVHERLALINVVFAEVTDVTAAAAAATDPAGPSGVTMTDEEFQLIVAEAKEVKDAVDTLLAYSTGDGGTTGG